LGNEQRIDAYLEAEVEKLQLRLGSSDFTIQGVLENLTNPTIRYRLRSPKLNLVDLTNLPEYKSDWMKDFTSEGEFQIKNGTPSVDAEISLGEGLLQALIVPDVSLCNGDMSLKQFEDIFHSDSIQNMADP